MTDATRLGARTWWALVVVGLAGQLAWVIENMYLNVYIYDTISTLPAVIAVTVAASAVAATLTTLIAGAWSDRLGRRRPLIAGGYALWGLTTAAFGLFGGHAGTAAATFTFAAAGIVAIDALMTVVGSTANDAAFNAWVTDSTVPANRGRVDGVLAVFPLLSMLLVFGLLDPLTQAGRWQLFFLIVGGVTSAVGVAAWFLVRDLDVPVREVPLISAVLAQLRPAAVRANPVLYATLAVFAVFGAAVQVFMPYLIIYVRYYLRIENYAMLLGVVVLAASALSVVGGRVMDAVGKDAFLLPAMAALALGLVGMWVTREMWPVTASATVMMAGMLGVTACLTAMIRDATPADTAGTTQGLRIVAAVLVPMLIGPAIGAAVIAGAGETYTDLGVAKPVPGPQVFAAALLVLALAPVVALVRRRLLAGRTT